MTTTTLTLAAIAAVLTLSATAACSTGPVADGANPTSTTSASPAASTYLPDDTSDPAPATSTQRDTSLAELQELAFMDATCEMLDDGYSLDSVMLGAVMTDKPFSDERAGELIVEAIIDDCPAHVGALEQLIAEEGY